MAIDNVFIKIFIAIQYHWYQLYKFTANKLPILLEPTLHSVGIPCRVCWNLLPILLESTAHSAGIHYLGQPASLAIFSLI